MAVDETVALATATAEEAIRCSFDQSAAALNDRVMVSLEAFDKRIDALHGSTYGHLKKTTLPDFARRLDALEARGVRQQPPATSRPDPDGDEDIRIVGDAPRTTVGDAPCTGIPHRPLARSSVPTSKNLISLSLVWTTPWSGTFGRPPTPTMTVRTND